MGRHLGRNPWQRRAEAADEDWEIPDLELLQREAARELHDLSLVDPEGLAVGVAIAGAITSDFNMAGALALSLGIAIQNVPEGAIISMPLRAEGNSRLKSFGIGALSGIVEPIGGALVLLLASAVIGIMPFMLAFAAGAMLYVVIEELVPETSKGEHSNIGTVGFALGFALMMVLDVVLG